MECGVYTVCGVGVDCVEYAEWFVNVDALEWPEEEWYMGVGGTEVTEP